MRMPAAMEEATEMAVRIAKFVLALILATASAVQQIELGGPVVAVPNSTAVPAAQSVPVVTAMRCPEAEQDIFKQINELREADGFHRVPSTRRSWKSPDCAPPTCWLGAASATTTR